VCLLVLCAASAALAARPASHTPANDDSPWFCHDLDCPKFTLVKNITDDVQLRKYAAGEMPRCHLYACASSASSTSEQVYCLPCMHHSKTSTNMSAQLHPLSNAGCISEHCDPGSLSHAFRDLLPLRVFLQASGHQQL
jgi:hypothetical protein